MRVNKDLKRDQIDELKARFSIDLDKNWCCVHVYYNVYCVLFWIKADGCLSTGGSTWSIGLAIMINSYSSYVSYQGW